MLLYTIIYYLLDMYVHRHSSAEGNVAAPTDAHDYYNMENIRRTDDAVTSPTYQQLQLPRPFDPSTLYSTLTPADDKMTDDFIK